MIRESPTTISDRKPGNAFLTQSTCFGSGCRGSIILTENLSALLADKFSYLSSKEKSENGRTSPPFSELEKGSSTVMGVLSSREIKHREI